MTTIKNANTGDVARVDTKGRFVTRASTEPDGKFETELGNGFNFNTGTVNLTNASESAVFYLKNNDDNTLIIDNIICIFGASTGGSGDLLINIERNPSGGTIVSNATAGDVQSNRNYGSNNPATVDFYKGAQGYTLTGGNDSITSIVTAPTRVVFPVALFLPKGASIGVLYTPPSGNTGMNVQTALQGYFQTVPRP